MNLFVECVCCIEVTLQFMDGKKKKMNNLF